MKSVIKFFLKESQRQTGSEPHFHHGINEQRIIVDETNLRSLFTICKRPGCYSAIDPAEVIVRYTGAVAHVSATCNNNHTEHWESSSAAGEGHSKHYVTNVLLVCMHSLNFL